MGVIGLVVLLINISNKYQLVTKKQAKRYTSRLYKLGDNDSRQNRHYFYMFSAELLNFQEETHFVHCATSLI